MRNREKFMRDSGLIIKKVDTVSTNGLTVGDILDNLRMTNRKVSEK